MKKLLLTISSLVIGISNINAQTSILLTNNLGNVVTNTSTVSVSTTVGGLADENDFTIKNIGSVSKDYLVRRIDNKTNYISVGDSASAYFCFGINCYPTSTTIIPTPYTMAPNATQSLKTYLEEASAQGYSNVTYQVYDSNNINDMYTFTMSYNTAMTVKDNENLLTSVSDVYPNPSVNKTQISINSKANVNASVSIINALGTVVSVKNIELSLGKNNIQLDSENLSSGIYFTTITSNNSKIVKKFTINK